MLLTLFVDAIYLITSHPSLLSESKAHLSPGQICSFLPGSCLESGPTPLHIHTYMLHPQNKGHPLSVIYQTLCNHCLAAFLKHVKLISIPTPTHLGPLFAAPSAWNPFLLVHGWLPSFIQPSVQKSSQEAFSVHMTYGIKVFIIVFARMAEKAPQSIFLLSLLIKKPQVLSGQMSIQLETYISQLPLQLDVPYN